MTACSAASTVTVTASPTPQIPVTVADPTCHNAVQALMTALGQSLEVNSAFLHGQTASALVHARLLKIVGNKAIAKAKPCLRS